MNTEEKKDQVSIQAEQVSISLGEESTSVTAINAYHQNEQGDVLLDTGLKAGLKDRMINLIAICGILGPGLFIGKSLKPQLWLSSLFT